MRKNLLVILFLFVSLGLFAQETNLSKLMRTSRLRGQRGVRQR